MNMQETLHNAKARFGYLEAEATKHIEGAIAAVLKNDREAVKEHIRRARRMMAEINRARDEVEAFARRTACAQRSLDDKFKDIVNAEFSWREEVQ